MALLSTLVAVVLPAVHAVRETARLTQCTNNIHQLALACLLHESSRHHLPAGGWSYEWSPDPDCGFGRSQPGTWTYHILPYLDEASLHDTGRDGRTWAITEEQRQAAARRIETPVAVFQCPVRRSANGPITGGSSTETHYVRVT